MPRPQQIADYALICAKRRVEACGPGMVVPGRRPRKRFCSPGRPRRAGASRVRS